MRAQKILWIIPVLLLASCNSSGNDANNDSYSESAENTIESANTATSDNPQNQAQNVLGDVQFKDTLFMFGRVEEGVEVERVFTFQSTGKGAVYISQVSPGCTCTVTDYTKEAIAPGKEGKIKATFDTKGKGGPGGVLNEKTVDVYFQNSITEHIVLKFKAYIFNNGDSNN